MGAALGWMVVLFVLRAEPAAAQDCDAFFEPVLVTDGSGGAVQASLGVDLTQIAYVTSVNNSRVLLRIIGSNLQGEKVLSTGSSSGQGDPVVETNSSGVTFIAFVQEDSEDGVEDREIFLTDNRGGEVKQPWNVSRNRVDDYSPKISLDISGRPHLVWAQSQGDLQRVVYYHDRLPEPMLVGPGDYPDLAIGPDGRVHVVVMRERDLYYIATDGTGNFGGEIPVLRTPKVQEFFPSIGVGDDGTAYIAYESQGALYLTSNSGAGFSPPHLVDGGGITTPDFRIRPGSLVSFVYEKMGDIYYVLGSPQFLLEPMLVCKTPEVESRPSMRIDLTGNIHLSFIRDGEVYYTNNSSRPTTQFTATPREGELPLRVEFNDLSNGQVQIWKWDFGDGNTSNQQNPIHVYENTGKYTVKLQIFGPGGESELVREDFIFVQDFHNTMSLPPLTVYPSQQQVWYPVIGTYQEPIQGYQIAGRFDPNVLELVSATYANSFTAGGSPEFFDSVISNEPGNAYFTIGMAVDIVPPITGRRILPLEKGRIANLVFNVESGAPQGGASVVELRNRVGPNNIFCIYVVEGQARLPGLSSGTVKVIELAPPLPRLFIRGDVDGNGSIDISDPILLLGYLFLGEASLPCEDPADANDAGAVDISGAIFILSYLFLGGGEPAPPFPNPGLDPTEDALVPCRL